MKGMNYQDYIWDLGGTLLDNYETSTAAFVQTLKEFGLQAGHDEVYKALKVSTDYAVQQFAPQEKDFLKFYKANEAEELTHPVLFDGAADLLRRIVAKGGRNFLVSHRDNQVLEILEKTAISSAFTEVVTAANGFPRKPSPDSWSLVTVRWILKQGRQLALTPISLIICSILKNL